MKCFSKIILYSILFLNVYTFCSYYEQRSQIVVCAENPNSQNAIFDVLDRFGLRYKKEQALLASDDKNLYVLSGKLSSLARLSLPRYYILHQTEVLAGAVNQRQLQVLSNAVAVWDFSQANIQKYRGSVKNFYYVPSADFELLDPIILPCFLPLKAMDGYKKMLEYSNSNHSDISEHIPSLFCHCVFQNPAIIIEAGVRWGDGSTKPMHAATIVSGAHMVGIDIDDCSRIYAPLSNTTFVRMSDLNFPDYFLKSFGVKGNLVDFVFIDTSHQFEHSFKEIECFLSILSEHGTLGFHDTSPVLNDPRGVIEAIKKYFDLQYDESKYFSSTFERKGCKWGVVHYPFNNGMTIIKRLGVLA